MRNGKNYLAPNDSFEKKNLAVKVLKSNKIISFYCNQIWNTNRISICFFVIKAESEKKINKLQYEPEEAIKLLNGASFCRKQLLLLTL